MSLATVLSIAALAASITLLMKREARAYPLLATIASGLQVCIAFGWVSLSVAKIPLGLVLAVILVLAGAMLWIRSQGKSTTSASTVVALVGLIQLLAVLGVI